MSEPSRRGGHRPDDRRGRPQRDDRPGRDNRFRREDGGGKGQGERGRDRGRGGRPDERAGGDRGRPGQRSRTDAQGSRTTARRDERAERDEAPKVSGPALPEDVDFSELDMDARKELRSLPKDLAELVGKHLVAAGRLIDVDPTAALEHAKFVKTKASRIPVVREAVGIAAYHAGQWQEALSELRAVRRMTRSDMHVAVMADAERALGRPERALDLAKETDSSSLPPEVAVELRIVAAGARRDLGQLDAAVVSLQGSDLDPNKRHPWSARLFYAYADNLLAAGREAEAATWFIHAAEADTEEETDAAERAAELA